MCVSRHTFSLDVVAVVSHSFASVPLCCSCVCVVVPWRGSVRLSALDFQIIVRSIVKHTKKRPVFVINTPLTHMYLLFFPFTIKPYVPQSKHTLAAAACSTLLLHRSISSTHHSRGHYRTVCADDDDAKTHPPSRLPPLTSLTTITFLAKPA